MTNPYPKPWPSATGNVGSTKDGDEAGVTFRVEDEIWRPQTNAPGKLLTLQLLHIVEKDEYEVRLGYYNYNIEKARWYWSRYTAMAPLHDFEALVTAAKRRWKDVWPKGPEIIPIDLEALAKEHGRTSWKRRWGSG